MISDLSSMERSEWKPLTEKETLFLGAAEQLFIKVGGIRPHELSQNLFFVEDFPVETAFYFCDIRYLQIHNILGLD